MAPLIISIALLVPFGELITFQVFDMRVRVLDIVVAIATCWLVVQQRQVIKKNIVESPWFPLCIALVASALANMPSYNLVSLSYLLRTLLYFIFFALIINEKLPLVSLRKALLIGLLLLLVSSLVQYVAYPDMRNLLYAGYDPHLGRLVGPYLDPNLLGVALVLYSSTFFPWGALFLAPFLLLTYSRISLSAFILAIIYRNRLMGIVVLCAIAAAVFFLPRNEGIGTDLLRANSIRSKSENVQYASALWLRNPLFGIGFNTLPQQRHSLLPYPDNSRFGIDNSILTVLATAGIVGIGTLGYSIFLLWQRFSSPIARMLTLALLLHSVSVNSLFTPSIFILYTLCLISCTPPLSLSLPRSPRYRSPRS